VYENRESYFDSQDQRDVSPVTDSAFVEKIWSGKLGSRGVCLLSRVSRTCLGVGPRCRLISLAASGGGGGRGFDLLSIGECIADGTDIFGDDIVELTGFR